MKISLALCTYNGEKYLRPQLNSILYQQRTPDEIVVCDDCSTDGTVDILREYESTQPDVFDIVINKRNLGPDKNFENAIRRCTGDVIAVCDQDDIWDENKLKHQADVYKNTDEQLVCHNSRVHLDGGETTLWESLSPPYSPQNRDPTAQVRTLLKRNFVQGATMLFGADIREKCPPVPEHWVYDYWIAIMAALHGDIRVIDEPLLRYRQHEEQLIGAKKEDNAPKIKQYLASHRHSYQRRANRLAELADGIKALDSSKTVVDNQELIESINRKKRFFDCRAVIHNRDKKRRERAKQLIQNVRIGGYENHGSGAKSVAKDMVFAAV